MFNNQQYNQEEINRIHAEQQLSDIMKQMFPKYPTNGRIGIHNPLAPVQPIPSISNAPYISTYNIVLDFKFSKFFIDFDMNSFINGDFNVELIDLKKIINVYREFNIRDIICVFRHKDTFRTLALSSSRQNAIPFYNQTGYSSDDLGQWNVTTDIVRPYKLNGPSFNHNILPSNNVSGMINLSPAPERVYYDYNNEEIIISNKTAQTFKLVEYVKDIATIKTLKYVFFRAYKHNPIEYKSYESDRNFDTGVVFIDLPNNIVTKSKHDERIRVTDYKKAFENCYVTIKELGYNIFKPISRDKIIHILHGEVGMDNSDDKDTLFMPDDLQELIKQKEKMKSFPYNVLYKDTDEVYE